MVEINIAYEGQLRCQAVHKPSQTSLATDAPVDNQGRGETFSPTDLVATALGACIVTIMGILARRDGIKLDGTKVRVEKHMSTDLPRRIAKLVVQVEFVPGIPGERREMLERASKNCPVLQSLHPAIDIQISFSYPD
jgi:putative redox protein